MQAQARHANVNTTLGYINSQEGEKAKASTALLGDSAKVNPSHESGGAVEGAIDLPDDNVVGDVVDVDREDRDKDDDYHDVVTWFPNPDPDDVLRKQCLNDMDRSQIDKELLMQSYAVHLDKFDDHHLEEEVDPHNLDLNHSTRGPSKVSD